MAEDEEAVYKCFKYMNKYGRLWWLKGTASSLHAEGLKFYLWHFQIKGPLPETL